MQALASHLKLFLSGIDMWGNTIIDSQEERVYILTRIENAIIALFWGYAMIQEAASLLMEQLLHIKICLVGFKPTNQSTGEDQM